MLFVLLADKDHPTTGLTAANVINCDAEDDPIPVPSPSQPRANPSPNLGIDVAPLPHPPGAGLSNLKPPHSGTIQRALCPAASGSFRDSSSFRGSASMVPTQSPVTRAAVGPLQRLGWPREAIKGGQKRGQGSRSRAFCMALGPHPPSPLGCPASENLGWSPGASTERRVGLPYAAALLKSVLAYETAASVRLGSSCHGKPWVRWWDGCGAYSFRALFSISFPQRSHSSRFHVRKKLGSDSMQSQWFAISTRIDPDV